MRVTTAAHPPMVYTDVYEGDRYIYAYTLHAPGYGYQPDGWIVGTLADHPRYRHGTIQYPFEIAHEVCAEYGLVFVGMRVRA